MTDITQEGQRTVAITGAGGGLGRATALAFAAKGYRVFGTALKPEEVADLKAASGGAVSLGICNITDEAAVAVWAREVTGRTNGRLDLLIQNAGLRLVRSRPRNSTPSSMSSTSMCSARSPLPMRFCPRCASSAAVSFT